MKENLSTTFNINDKVWIMYNNRPIECKIIGIQIIFGKGSYNHGINSYNKTTLLKMIHMGITFVYNEKFYSVSFFSTKEELLKSL